MEDRENARTKLKEESSSRKTFSDAEENRISEEFFDLYKERSISHQILSKKLINAGFTHQDVVMDNYEFSFKGNLVDIKFDHLFFKVDFFGNEIEEIILYDEKKRIVIDKSLHAIRIPYKRNFTEEETLQFLISEAESSKNVSGLVNKKTIYLTQKALDYADSIDYDSDDLPAWFDDCTYTCICQNCGIEFLEIEGCYDDESLVDSEGNVVDLCSRECHEEYIEIK